MTTTIAFRDMTPRQRRAAERELYLPTGHLDQPRYMEPHQIEKFSPDQPRHPAGSADGLGGQWRPASGATGSAASRSLDDMKEANRGKTLEQVHAEAVENQKVLNEVGAKLEEELGLKYVTGKQPLAGPYGEKLLESAREKLIRKPEYENDPANLTDLSRATFVIDSPADAQTVVDNLASRSQVFDEGWYVQPESGYLDRKLLVQAPNGGISEIQIIPSNVYREKDGRGWALYQMARTPGTPAAQVILYNQLQRAVYRRAAEADGFGFHYQGME